MKSIQKLWIEILLKDNQKFFIRNLKNDYSRIKTDMFGKLFYTNNNILFVLNLKEETIEVFINRVYYTKQLMSLKVLRYCWSKWYRSEILKPNTNLKKGAETNLFIVNNTPLKYLFELIKLEIDTKNIFT
jgi:hypothetical protein